MSCKNLILAIFTYHLSLAFENRKKTKMKTNNSQLEKDLSVVPSTSKEPSQTTGIKTSTTYNLPHITPLPNQTNDGMKFLQLSPISSLSQHNNDFIQENAPLPKLILSNFQEYNSPMTSSGRTVSNITISPITHNPALLAGEMPVTIENIKDFSILTPNSQAMDVRNNSAGRSPVSSPIKNVVPNFLPFKMKHTPSLLNRKQKNNTLETSISNPSTSKNIEKVSDKINKVVLTTRGQKTGLCKSRQISQHVSTKNKKDGKKETIKSPKKNSRSLKKSSKDSTKPDDAEKKTNLAEANLYIADGFREDVQTLIKKCLHAYKLNYEKFTEIWKEMSFPNIFHRRQSSAELAEFSEEVIQIAKSYMLAKHVSFEENVAGLFLVYALLNYQPFPEFAPLRLVPDDVPQVLHLQNEARQQKRHDILYILGKVLIKGPCQFHVVPREVALELPIRKYFDGTVQVPELIQSVFTQNADCVQHFKELVSLEQRYKAMRQKLRDKLDRQEKVRELCTQPAAKLLGMFRERIPRESCPDGTDNLPISPQNTIDHSAHIRSVKERAMANVVDSIPHLTGIQERIQEAFSSSDEEIETKIRRTQRKPKVKGKGRGSAQTLQELFNLETTVKKDEYVPESSSKEMPIVDFGNTATESSSSQIISHNNNIKSNEPKPHKNSTKPNDKCLKLNKKLPNQKLKKVISDDSKNNNHTEVLSKREGIKKNQAVVNAAIVKKNKETKKIHVIESDSNSDFIELEDLIGVEVNANRDRNTASKSHKTYTNKKKAKSKNDDLKQKPGDQLQKRNTEQDINQTYLIKDKIENITKDIEQVINICKEEEDKTAKKDKNTDSTMIKTDSKHIETLKDSNSFKSDDTNNKNKEEDIIKKTNEKDEPTVIPNEDTSAISRKILDKVLGLLEADESDEMCLPLQKLMSPKTQTRKAHAKNTPNPEKTGSPKTPKSKRQSPRIKDLHESPRAIEATQAPRKRKTESENDDDEVFVFPKAKVMKRGNKRLKSTFKKLGILEVADMSSGEEKADDDKVGRFIV